MANREGQQVDTLPSQQYGWDGAVPVKILSDSSGNIINTSRPYAIMIDSISTTQVTYIGKAAVGSLISDPVWQIMKIDESGSPINTVINYADGNADFDNIFSNRTSLSYS